jgi:hypothetical protein
VLKEHGFTNVAIGNTTWSFNSGKEREAYVRKLYQEQQARQQQPENQNPSSAEGK